MQEHSDCVAEMLSYLQLMGGSCWRTSVTCSSGDSWVCNSVKTKHEISTSLVKQRWVACLAAGNGDTCLEMENTSPGAWRSIFPAASVRYLGLFLLPLLALTFSQPYTFFHSFCSSCALRKKLMPEPSFCSTEGWVLLLSALHTSRPPAPSHHPGTTALYFSTDTTGFWNRHPPSCLLPFRGSLVTYKISPFSMQIVTATLTLQSLQQQALCHCRSIKFSDSV